MKKIVGLAMIGIFLFWLSACSQEKGIAPPLQDKKLAPEKLEKSKKEEDPEKELKELTLEAIQKEGKMKEVTPGMVQVSLERQQLIGVKFGQVERKSIEKLIRTVGRIDYDEKRLVTISPKIGGWIEELYVDFTGKYVRQGEPLLTIYSPELVSAQAEY
ncbi:MAG: efflux RND transporter periplasmic adaptor subunit, partial [bacterium]